MKTKKLIGFYLFNSLFLAILLSTGCSKGKPDNFDYGKVENNKYTNSYFGCEISLPGEWVVQSREQLDGLSEEGRDMLAGESSTTKAMLKASEIRSANLLGVFKYQRGAAVDFNPNFMVVAENVSALPGIKTGSDYLFQTKKLLSKTQLQYDYIDTVFAVEKINGTPFHRMNASIDAMGTKINQEYYSTIMRGFSFCVILTYNTDEHREELMSMFNTLKFN
jgi:hypothetical protein